MTLVVWLLALLRMMMMVMLRRKKDDEYPYWRHDVDDDACYEDTIHPHLEAKRHAHYFRKEIVPLCCCCWSVVVVVVVWLLCYNSPPRPPLRNPFWPDPFAWMAALTTTMMVSFFDSLVDCCCCCWWWWIVANVANLQNQSRLACIPIRQFSFQAIPNSLAL